MARILVFAGSARRESLNKKLARVGFEAVKAAGGEATFMDLDDYEMPVYHGDLEAERGMPENARKVRDLFMAHQALLIASPENNQSVTSLLKNTIDWLSRGIGDGKGANSGLAPFRGKVAGLMGASPGAFGAVRGLPHLRQILSGLGVTVLPMQVALPHANEAFEADGRLKDPRVVKSVESLGASLVETARKLKA